MYKSTNTVKMYGFQLIDSIPKLNKIFYNIWLGDLCYLEWETYLVTYCIFTIKRSSITAILFFIQLHTDLLMMMLQ